MMRNLLIPAVVLAMASACSGDGDAPAHDAGVHDDTSTNIDANDVDVSTNVDTSADVENDDDTGEDTPDVNLPDPQISDVSVVESPSNVLAWYVDYTTDVAVGTDVRVTCASDDDYTAVALNPAAATTSHSVFVMGLVEDDTCELVITAGTSEHRESRATGTLPDYLPEATVVMSDAGGVQPGWTLVNLNNHFDGIPLTLAIFDEQGRIRWYHRTSLGRAGADTAVALVPEGILVGEKELGIFDWQGNLVWQAGFETQHHEARPDPDVEGLYWYLGVVECGDDPPADSVIAWNYLTDTQEYFWSFCDHYTPDPIAPDWSHTNTIQFVPGDDDLLISSRNQNALMRIDRDTGDIVWVLGWGNRIADGFDGDFAMEEDARFYQQHDPVFVDDDSILMFDNGHSTRPYSRALQLRITEGDEPTAELEWEFRPEPDIYAPIWGDADRLDNGNTLVTFGLRSTTDTTHVIEVDRDANEVWHLQLPVHWGIYRSERIVPPSGFVLVP